MNTPEQSHEHSIHSHPQPGAALAPGAPISESAARRIRSRTTPQAGRQSALTKAACSQGTRCHTSRVGRGARNTLLRFAALLLLGAASASAQQTYITLAVPLIAGNTPQVDLSGTPGDANGDISAFLWDAGRTAFRAGVYRSDSLNPWSIGRHSFATGYRTMATNGASFASGLLTTASGYGATAMGSDSVAAGTVSFAWGSHAMAVESGTFAAGLGVTAFQHGSAAFNYCTYAGGFASFAAGWYTRADAMGCFAVGTWNLGGYSGPTGDWNWNASDPVFEVGNGTNPNNRSNALTVYKSGRVIIPKRQGDILMGEFGNPGSGD